MMRTLRIVFVIIAMLPLLFYWNACTNAPLEEMQLSVSVQSKGDFCTKDPEETARYTKYLFVIDRSGSNVQAGIGTRRWAGSDPNVQKRGSALQTFYDSIKDNDYARMGLITFRDSTARVVIGEPNKPKLLPAKDPAVAAAVSGFATSDVDEGGTPYGSAFAMTQQAIIDDVKDFPDEDSTYVIFFISDGVPTDVDDVDTLGAMVENITAIRPGRVFFSTAYYTSKLPDDLSEAQRAVMQTQNSKAEATLRSLATKGRGKFINFEDAPVIDVGDLIPQGPARDPWVIKNFLVYNLNATICEDGNFDTDSDGDGLCDRDELMRGFNPTKRFSRPGGYGDYFRWREQVLGESLPACADRSDNDFDMLTVCEEGFIYIKTPVSPSSSIVIPNRGDPNNPDTDLDGFLDGLEVFSFRDTSSPMNARDVLMSKDSEESSGVQIMKHKNPNKYDPNIPVYDTRITPRSQNVETGQTCYNFSQTTLPLYTDTLEVLPEDNFPQLAHAAGENTVYVHFIQTLAQDPMGKGVLMYSFQNLVPQHQGGSTAGLNVNDGVFYQYVVPSEE